MLGNEKEKSEGELIAEYRETKAPNILAYFFVSNFGLSITVGLSYPDIDMEEKASFSVRALDKALLSYRDDGTAQFDTYYMAIFRCMLRSVSSMIHTDKRKIQLYQTLTDFNDAISIELIDNQEIYEDDYFDIDDFANYNRLNESEREQCKLINDGFSAKEICKKLKKSLSWIYIQNKRIQKKILDADIKYI